MSVIPQSFLSSFATLGHFWQEKINNQLFRWNIFFLGLQILYLLFRFSKLPPEVPLYFSLPWGESQLAPASMLFIIPTLSIIILLINNIFAIFLLSQSRLLSRILVIFSVIYSFLSLVALFQIINLIS